MGASYRNGLYERVGRSLKAALRAILSDDRAQPPQRILTQSATARNHVPQTAAGRPPAMEMAGSCDLAAGDAATAWTHDPASSGPAAAQGGEMRNILNARAAVLRADAQRALTTCIGRNLPGRGQFFYTTTGHRFKLHCVVNGSVRIMSLGARLVI